MQSSILQGWGACVTFTGPHTQNRVYIVPFRFPNNWRGLPFVYLLVYFHVTYKSFKVLSCPGVTLLYVHQPSFYRITGPNHKTWLCKMVSIHVKSARTASWFLTRSWQVFVIGPIRAMLKTMDKTREPRRPPCLRNSCAFLQLPLVSSPRVRILT